MKRSWQEDAVWFIWIKFLIVVDNLLGYYVFSLWYMKIFHSSQPLVVYVANVFHSSLFEKSMCSFSFHLLQLHVLFFHPFSIIIFIPWKFVLFWLNCQCPTCTINPLCKEHIVLRHYFSLFKPHLSTTPKKPHQHPPNYHYSCIVVESQNMSLVTLIRTKVRTFSWKITYTTSFKGSYSLHFRVAVNK